MPATLRPIRRPTLLAYLGTHRAFFAARGLDLQSLSDADSSADFEPLVNHQAQRLLASHCSNLVIGVASPADLQAIAACPRPLPNTK